MALPPIVAAGAPVLRHAAEPVSQDLLGTPKLRELADTLIQVMRAAPGVGLAAPQIGIPLQLIVLEDTPERVAQLSEADRRDRERVPFDVRTFVNPALIPVGGDRVTFFEGCLSVPGYTSLVERWTEVEVHALDLDGKPIQWRVRGWPARILQHEVDHLNGILYVDRMQSRALSTLDEAQRRWSGKSVKQIKSELGISEGPPKGF